MATGRNILSGVVTQEAIQKLCYHKIEAVVPSSIAWDNVIGQGTYGIILGTIHEPNWVVKVANHTKQCRVMDHEYTLHENANAALRELKSRTDADMPIFCPQTRRFAHTEGCCWYYMTRIWKGSKLPKLMHCLIFNDQSTKTQEKHSGIYPTPQFLSDHVKTLKTENKLNAKINGIKDVAFYNGVIFGLLHYGSKQTAQDIEIVLGKNSQADVYNVFFYDFDKSEQFEEYTEPIVKLLAVSMSGSYGAFTGPLGDRFKEGYRLSARIFEQSDVCERVIAKCEGWETMLLEDEEVEHPNYDGGQATKTHKRKFKSRKFKSRKFKSRKFKSHKFKSRKFKSRKFK